MYSSGESFCETRTEALNGIFEMLYSPSPDPMIYSSLILSTNMLDLFGIGIYKEKESKSDCISK